MAVTSLAGRKQSGGIVTHIIKKKMALSARTLMRERAWSKLIRSLPEGKNFLPVKMPQGEYLTLRTICKRENTYKTGFHYQSSFKKNQVTITKERRFDYDDQSNQQGLQGE